MELVLNYRVYVYNTVAIGTLTGEAKRRAAKALDAAGGPYCRTCRWCIDQRRRTRKRKGIFTVDVQPDGACSNMKSDMWNKRVLLNGVCDVHERKPA